MFFVTLKSLAALRIPIQRTPPLLALIAEPYTAHSTAIPAVQFNKVYLTPCAAVPSISVAAASDKRCSLAVTIAPVQTLQPP